MLALCFLRLSFFSPLHFHFIYFLRRRLSTSVISLDKVSFLNNAFLVAGNWHGSSGSRLMFDRLKFRKSSLLACDNRSSNNFHL